ncbi:DnaJ domain-containing protein [Coccidioides immitis RS]|uniref:DnaJ domain-containing protein n=2 Tax=Coccidioides immitis TaxID=5501 RepID=J3KA06_COCIM|nr:DnaJ domain-containing protein [Coccidioides immitis RS]EAS31805.3 DnaJ domain-containing protein [Coccidioides immitis RS]KMP02398.1 DNAJ domain containing protein Erj5 [Coccidioides immitis RMSCC 2394]TPX24522.1 hypothetical protein DIZ76_013869 [Coccidioides immitis]
MRQAALFRVLLLLAGFLALAAAWTKEDHEIFRLREEIIATEGVNVTFYDFLGVKPSASHVEITKAFRRKSKQLHPDKAKRSFIASRAKPPRTSSGKKKDGVHVSKRPSDREIQKVVKHATERYARLGIVHDVLKGPGRERYDHFLNNGFPIWKGSGYYYSRFRPGLGTVLIGLFLAFGGAAHYLALVLSWKRQVEFVDRYIRHARRAAWGDELGIQGIGNLSNYNDNASTTAAAENGEEHVVLNRKQKRMMEKENRKESKKAKKEGSSGTATPTNVVTSVGDRKRVVAENGKVLIVDAIGNVFLEEETEDGEKEEFFLDINEIHRPTMRDTLAYRLPQWLYRKLVGRSVQDTPSQAQDPVDDEVTTSAEPETDSVSTPDVSSKKARKRRGKNA